MQANVIIFIGIFCGTISLIAIPYGFYIKSDMENKKNFEYLEPLVKEGVKNLKRDKDRLENEVTKIKDLAGKESKGLNEKVDNLKFQFREVLDKEWVFRSMAEYGIRYLEAGKNGNVYLGKDILKSNGIILNLINIEKITEEQEVKIVNVLNEFHKPIGIIGNQMLLEDKSSLKLMRANGYECGYSSLNAAIISIEDDVCRKLFKVN